MFEDGARDTDPTRFGQCLQPCRNIDPVAEYVLGFDDHVAQIDPDAKSNPRFSGTSGSRSVMPR